MIPGFHNVPSTANLGRLSSVSADSPPLSRTGSSSPKMPVRATFGAVSLPSLFPTTSSSPMRRSALSGTSAENTAKKALAFLATPKMSFKKFNTVVDSLKKNDNWEGVVQSEVGKLNSDQLGRLAVMEEVDLRGFDREAIGVILTSIKESIQQKQIQLTPEENSRLEGFIQNLENTEVISTPPEKLTKLGGGAVNVVYKIEYKDSTGNDIVGVFKPDPSDLDFMTLLKEAHFGTAAASGIPAGDEAHLPSRAVASSVVDRLLYKDMTISVNTRFAIVNGQRGILMSRATGGSPKVRALPARQLVELKEYPEVLKFITTQTRSGKSIDTKALKFIATMMHVRSAEIRKDDSGKWDLFITESSYEHLDPSNPTTAKGLVKLQVKDFITGECDRHPGNYFIDGGGNVTGIDEDCCFGVNAVPEGVDIRKQPTLKGIIPNNASLMLRPPPVVTKDIKEQIKDIHEKRDELIQSLEPYVSKEEIVATLNRLQKLHDHVNSENCLVVDTDGELLSPAAKEKMNTNNSYLLREIMVYSTDEKGWNHLREHRKF